MVQRLAEIRQDEERETEQVVATPSCNYWRQLQLPDVLRSLSAQQLLRRIKQLHKSSR